MLLSYFNSSWYQQGDAGQEETSGVSDKELHEGKSTEAGAAVGKLSQPEVWLSSSCDFTNTTELRQLDESPVTRRKWRYCSRFKDKKTTYNVWSVNELEKSENLKVKALWREDEEIWPGLLCLTRFQKICENPPNTFY